MTSSVIATKLRVPSTPSMPVDRLDARLDAAWAHRLTLVVAPAGSGKTTLLSRFALRAPGPVGWYRAEGWDRDEAALLAHVEAALVPALEGIERDWQTIADAANALEAWHGERALLVIDDLHTLQGTPAEAALERLIDYAPANVTFAIASRVVPRSTCRACAWPQRSWRSAATTCASDRGRSSDCSTTSTPILSAGGAGPTRPTNRGLGSRPPAVSSGHARPNAG